MPLIIIGLIFLSEALLASSLPPLGKRVYVLEEREHFNPVAIHSETRKESSTREIVLRDSIPFPDPKKHSGSAVKLRIPETKAHRQAQLKFSSLAIRGRLSSPRIPFRTEAMSGTRADEGLEMDFVQAIESLALEQEQDSRTTPQY